jgi:hypothetical protein
VNVSLRPHPQRGQRARQLARAIRAITPDSAISPLDQIHTGNAGKLRMAWMRQINDTGSFSTSPIVWTE